MGRGGPLALAGKRRFPGFELLSKTSLLALAVHGMFVKKWVTLRGELYLGSIHIVVDEKMNQPRSQTDNDPHGLSTAPALSYKTK